jgi:hypothetical protein
MTIMYEAPCDECGAIAGQPCLSLWCPRGARREIGAEDSPGLDLHDLDEVHDYYDGPRVAYWNQPNWSFEPIER